MAGACYADLPVDWERHIMLVRAREAVPLDFFSPDCSPRRGSLASALARSVKSGFGHADRLASLQHAFCGQPP